MGQVKTGLLGRKELLLMKQIDIPVVTSSPTKRQVRAPGTLPIEEEFKRSN